MIVKKTKPTLPDAFIAPICHREIEVLHEDESILLINKPSGLLSLSGKNPLNKDSVHYRLVQDYPTATMVHRLDFGTSGLMLLALNKTANADLTKQFQTRTIIKTYVATLLGHLVNDNGVIDAPLAKCDFPYQKICQESGKSAQSYYQVIERLQDSTTGVKTTQVLFSPLTGRTHQLRVHSQEIGHPIIGCDLYGLTINGVASQSLAKRLMLHAASLSFDHPDSGTRMEFKCTIND
jgi:tRNA pseudouridine32 synthase/23S rRNA pseudouridine746 synthase